MKKNFGIIFLLLCSLCVIVVIGFIVALQTSSGNSLLEKLGFVKQNSAVVSSEQKDQPQIQKDSTFTFTVGGDVMLGRAVAWHFNNDVTKAFSNLSQDIFKDKNLGIINLEGPISDQNITPNPTANNFVFNFPFNSVDALKYLGVNAVSQGSNHSENQGKLGLTQTKNLLSNANIIIIGSQTTFDENSIAEFKGENVNLSVITINTLSNKDDLMASIKQEKQKGNLVMIFPHWGIEYQPTHSSNQQDLAHAWIDAGADIIIGSHPHVVQDAEIYKNKFIFYSLGNFIFDQNFSTETQHGMILSGKFTNNNLEILFLPTVIRNYQVELLEGSEKDNVISKFKNEIGLQYFKGDSLELIND